MRLYVASSWRNQNQPFYVDALRAEGHEVYDFRHPPGGDHLGFSWSDVDPDWQQWRPSQYLAGLKHPIAAAGFASDHDGMRWADGCVLLLPCGRSAHLEAGWFVGAGKPLWIVLSPDEFDGRGHAVMELMYRLATDIVDGPLSLRRAIETHEAAVRRWTDFRPIPPAIEEIKRRIDEEGFENVGEPVDG